MGLSNGAYTRTNGADNSQAETSVYPEFFLDTILDQAASEQQGRQIWTEEERVRIHFPGNPHTKPVFKVTDEHRERWPKHYAAFKAGHEISVDGLPLEQWPVLRKPQVLELKALGFQTVEQLANMPDLACQRIGMGGSRLKELAKAFLDEAEASALTKRLSDLNARLESENAGLNAKVAELSGLLDRVSSRLLAIENAPSAVASHIPGMHDPIEAQRQAVAQATPVQSSLDVLAAPRKRRSAAADAGT